MDFEEVKHVSLTDVAGRYQVRFRFRGNWASALCPLPMHRKDEKSKTFSVNVTQNYWRCLSESCTAANGGKKGGDVISFVSVVEGCGMKEAAESGIA